MVESATGADVVIDVDGTGIAMALPDRDRDHIQRFIAKQGRMYEQEMLEHAGVFLQPGDLVVDAGAFIGTHTLYFAVACRAQVVAFEPNPRSCHLLRTNVALNDVSANVRVLQRGLGARPGHAALRDAGEDNRGMTRLDATEDGDVEVVRLDDVELPQAPRMIKIDVEGMEVDVLRGGEATIRRHRPLLYVECASHRTLAAVTALLAGWDYVAGAQFNATPTVAFVPASQGLEAISSQIASLQYRLHDRLHTLDARLHTLTRRTATAEAAAARRMDELARQHAAVVDELRAARRRQQAASAEARVARELQERVADDIRAVRQHLHDRRHPLVVRALRRIARLTRNFVRDPRRFVRSVVQRRLKPATARASSVLVGHGVVPTVDQQRRLPTTSIVAVPGVAGLDRALAAVTARDTELVLLVRRSDRPRVARWLSDLRPDRLYVFERSRPTEEMLRYGLSRASGTRVVVLPATGAVSARTLSSALAAPPGDASAFADTGGMLVLGHHAAREIVTGHDVREPLAAAFARLCAPGADTADDDRTGIFVSTRPRHPKLADQMLVRRGELDRMVVYGRDPEPLLELLALRRDDAATGVELVNTRELPGYFVYVAPPATALFSEAAEDRGIICLERRPSWYQPVSEQVRAAAERVSVIMTVCNDVTTVDAAIDSILDQTYRNLELIVVDDGSTDGSLDVVRRRMSHDHRIRLLRTPTNSGTYVAKNIGLVHATGDFVTFQDADDISLSHRIELQVAALHSDPSASANLLRYQRISATSGRVLWIGGAKDRPCFATLMLRRRQVLDAIGYFDSVRVTADSELAARLAAATGRKPQTLPVVGYLARHVEGSLTTAGAGEITLAPDGTATLPAARVAYWEAAEQWHRRIADGTASPHVPFPLRQRPFPAPAEILPAAWAAGGETVTASLATIPERVALLEQAVASLLPQVDRLRVYLNNFDAVPAFLDDPKISVLRSQDHGDHRDNGKFFGVEQIPEGYHFTVDDDIVYPPDYVQKSILKIEQYGRRVAVGVHGVNLAEPLVRYTQGRHLAHFRQALPRDELVQLLGTGTLAYHTSTLRPTFDGFRTTGVADLWFAIQARQQGVALLAQARPARWLQPIDHDGERIFDRAQERDDRETEIARTHGPWTAEALAAIWRPLARDIVEHHPVAALTAMGENGNQLAALAGRQPVRFTLIVPGWNCADRVAACWRSIERQRPGHYTREVHFVDDASTDGTWEALRALTVDDDVHLIRHERNRGPAYARWSVLQEITDPDRVCILLDMDDELADTALWRLAEVYATTPDVWLTSGDWRDQDGRANPLAFYEPSVVDRRAYRDVPLFKCTHVRSFRRFLCDPLEPRHFQDPDGGGWLLQCSDVALLLPLLEQCGPENIVHLHDTLYRYHRRRDSGTIERFGKARKVATYRALGDLPRMPPRAAGAAPVTDGIGAAQGVVGPGPTNRAADGLRRAGG